MRTKTAVAVKTETTFNTQTEAVAAARGVAKSATAQPKKAGFSFGVIGVKKSSGKTDYPSLPDDLGTAGDIARDCREIREEIESLNGDKERSDAELYPLIYQWYWQNYHGKAEIPSSVYVICPEKKDPQTGEVKPATRILVTIPAHYKSINPKLLDAAKAKIESAIGSANFEAFFRDTFEIKVDGDKIAAEHQQEFINELSALCEKFNCIDALEANPTIRPVEEFHTKRHRALTVEQNRALNEAFPVIPKLKIKGIE